MRPSSVATSSVMPNDRSPSSSWIGSRDGLTAFFAGTIDDVRIWNVARSSDDIAREIAGTVTATEPGLVAYFDCDAIIGTRLPDVSNHGNDGTLGGGDPKYEPTLVASTVP